MCSAEAAGTSLSWHKIVCRAPAGTVTFGRASYTHMLCVSRALRGGNVGGRRPAAARRDDLGGRDGQRSMHVAALFIAEHMRCRVVVDPFCGSGSMLTAANARGLDTIGIELSRRRAKRAERP